MIGNGDVPPLFGKKIDSIGEVYEKVKTIRRESINREDMNSTPIGSDSSANSSENDDDVQLLSKMPMRRRRATVFERQLGKGEVEV